MLIGCFQLLGGCVVLLMFAAWMVGVCDLLVLVGFAMWHSLLAVVRSLGVHGGKFAV